MQRCSVAVRLSSAGASCRRTLGLNLQCRDCGCFVGGGIADGSCVPGMLLVIDPRRCLPSALLLFSLSPASPFFIIRSIRCFFALVMFYPAQLNLILDFYNFLIDSSLTVSYCLVCYLSYLNSFILLTSRRRPFPPVITGVFLTVCVCVCARAWISGCLHTSICALVMLKPSPTSFLRSSWLLPAKR